MGLNHPRIPDNKNTIPRFPVPTLVFATSRLAFVTRRWPRTGKSAEIAAALSAIVIV
jgi:hypothetical protein